MSQRASRILIILYLVFPFLVFIFKLDSLTSPDVRETAEVFRQTLVQAGLSSALILFFGYFAAQGLKTGLISNPWNEATGKKKLEQLLPWIYLAPNFIPSIFIVLSLLNWFTPFPFGLRGVVFCNVLMNVGFAGILISRLYERKLSVLADQAHVLGVSSVRFFVKIFFPVLFSDLWYLFLFFFGICFTSFTVPLLLGGHHFTTVEVLIYEKIHFFGKWSEALMLAVLQSLMILVFIPRADLTEEASHLERKSIRHYFTNHVGRIIPILCTLLCISGLFPGVIKGFTSLLSSPEILQQSLKAFLGTLLLMVLLTLFFIALFLVIFHALPHRYFEKFLLSYLTPGSVVTAFSFLLVGGVSIGWSIRSVFMVLLALGVLFVPLIYRMGLHNHFKSLQVLRERAFVMGATRLQIFNKITFPLLKKELFFFSALGAFWASCDFVVIGLLTNQDVTLALLIQNLIGSYRLEVATVLSWFLLALGAFVIWFFGRISDVRH